MKKKNQRILEIIEEMEEFILYKDDIANNCTIHSNSAEFKLPTANTDWCNDLFKVITFMTKKYPVYINGECLKPNVLLLNNTRTMI